MTGNDIVDLELAALESNWNRKGFLEKIFTGAERASILESDSPFHNVWRLWSMKESAYKIQNRLSGQRSFAPASFKSRIINDSDGMVFHGNAIYHTRTIMSPGYIYTVARRKYHHRTDHLGSCFKLPLAAEPHYRTFIESELIGRYALFSGVPGTELRLQKDERGIPYLSGKNIRRIIPVSITHHGNYAAFTIN